MKPLEKTLRNQLERAIKEARDVAEAAARAALEQLGVGEPKPYGHLSDEQRQLRLKLRAHGRQLGNGRKADGSQELGRLIEEVAYEHWHRMLFARFLAENNLLMYPDPVSSVAVTLEECEDLAADEGAANGWELAARFAARMLPQIFRLDSPVFQLTLPPEHQQKLERLVADLPLEVFTASDSLGWVYQFWQAKKKDEVNASEVKIGARELPAVTQLFTEPYMVSFLLDNSLGAWWAARRLTESDLKNASSEEELRSKASIPGVPLDYLRFVQKEDGTWTPAAGTFDGWPENLSELKTLDPCCGSGHFLVAAFLMLVPMRLELEGPSAREAVDAVLRDNIHGLELDQRCVELAAFALALTAWKYPDAGGYRVLPELNVACSGLAISAKKEEWLALAGDDTNLRLALEELYKQFKDAPVLGSLINPKTSLDKGSLFELKWEEVEPLLTKALAGEKDEEKTEMGVVASGLTKAAHLLRGNYVLVCTNVPYLGQRDQGPIIRSYLKKYHEFAKADLATAFLHRSLDWVDENGTIQNVTPQNWLFLRTYTDFRKELLMKAKWNLVARLGPQAFQTPMYDFNVQLLTISKALNDAGDVHPKVVRGIDASGPRDCEEKARLLVMSSTQRADQSDQLGNPDAVISFEARSKGKPLFNYAECFQGASTLDIKRFRFQFWEVMLSDKWNLHISTPSGAAMFTGNSYVSYTRKQGEGMYELAAKMKEEGFLGGWLSGNKAWGKRGVACSWMNKLPATPYYGAVYDNMAAVIIPNDESMLPAIWAYCSSPEFNREVRKINQKVQVANATLVKVPFDIERWSQVAQDKFSDGLPKPYSDDPTQWIFHGHPCGSVVWNEDKKWTAHGPLRTDHTVLQVAVARLLGYRWPAELDVDMELADEQREWVKRCETLLPFADEDGIACIPPVRGEAAASDRLLNLLAAAFNHSGGDAWSNDILAKLLKYADHAGKSLETWLRDKFFTQHCKLFHYRPFIWHIWDGLPDGFAALVNYHKFDHKLLETLIYTYLGDWISRQKQDVATGADGAEEKLAVAESLKKKLELILRGEAPYDIFVRWKPLEKQPIGWEPDLNDGVRLNSRPFLTVPDVKKKGAGVLRDKPNIHWKKDRGKDVASAPWYHLGLQYGGKEGDRINDHHLTLAEKHKARREAGL